MIRDMDLPAPEARGGRRIEIVADGLPLFGGAQLAVDATLVSPLHCDGSSMAGADLAQFWLRHVEERKGPTLSLWVPYRLVVLAGEVGGWWSHEVSTFMRLLARAKARTQHSAAQGGTSMAAQVGHHLGLFGSSCLRLFRVGREDAWGG